jgi:HAD superfamily hydrolase (TIGR01549 family)
VVFRQTIFLSIGEPLIKAVTFDFWNTLVWETPGQLVERRLAAWAELLEAAGLPVDSERLNGAHQLAFEEYQNAWRHNRQYVVEDATASMLSALGLEVSDRLAESLIASFDRAGSATDLQLTVGIDDCLRTLKAAGIGMAIVCDVGLTPSQTLLRYLDRRGLLELFGGWAFSDQIGVYKPEPRIFLTALGQLDVAPEEAAHVGDRRRTDIAGARNLGMLAVRYSGVYDDRKPDEPEDEPEADYVIAELAELPSVVATA